MGGGIALQLALRHPEMLAGAFALSSYMCDDAAAYRLLEGGAQGVPGGRARAPDACTPGREADPARLTPRGAPCMRGASVACRPLCSSTGLHWGRAPASGVSLRGPPGQNAKRPPIFMAHGERDGFIRHRASADPVGWRWLLGLPDLGRGVAEAWPTRHRLKFRVPWPSSQSFVIQSSDGGGVMASAVM